MTLVSQTGSTITLKPIFYGGEACGPILKLSTESGDISYRIKIKSDGRLELRKQDMPNEA